MDSSVTQLATQLLDFFYGDAYNQALSSCFVQRRSKLTAPAFLKMLITSAISHRKASLSDMCGLLEEQNINVTTQGLDQRFNANTVTFMRQMLNLSIKKLVTDQSSPLDTGYPFSSIKLFDSTGFGLPATLKEEFPGYGGGASSAGIKIQTLWNYTKGALEHIGVTSSRVPDQGYRDHLSTIEKDALYLGDLGYFSIKNFEMIDSQHAYFISRYSKVKIYSSDTDRQLILSRALNKTKSDGVTLQVRIGQKAQFPVRLVAFKVQKAVVEKRKREAHKEARKKGYAVKKETLALMKWSIFITNIPEEVMTADQVRRLYSLRWQIELFFKLCKSNAGLNAVSGKRSARVLSEIYAKLIVVTLLLYIVTPIRWNESQEISFPKAYKQLQSAAYEFLISLRSLFRMKKFIKKLLSRCKQFSMKDKSRRKRKPTAEILIEMDREKGAAYAA